WRGAPAWVRAPRARPAGSAGSWCRHEYESSGKPWLSTTSGPLSPASTTCRSTPLVETVRSRVSGMEGVLRRKGGEELLAGRSLPGRKGVVVGVGHHLGH